MVYTNSETAIALSSWLLVFRWPDSPILRWPD